MYEISCCSDLTSRVSWISSCLLSSTRSRRRWSRSTRARKLWRGVERTEGHSRRLRWVGDARKLSQLTRVSLMVERHRICLAAAGVYRAVSKEGHCGSYQLCAEEPRSLGFHPHERYPVGYDALGLWRAHRGLALQRECLRKSDTGPDRLGHVLSRPMGSSERTIPRRVLIALCSSGPVSSRSGAIGRSLHSPPPLVRAISTARRSVARVPNDPAVAGRTAPSHSSRVLHVPPGPDVVLSDSVIATVPHCRA